jgi:hypothetical protein
MRKQSMLPESRAGCAKSCPLGMEQHDPRSVMADPEVGLLRRRDQPTQCHRDFRRDFLFVSLSTKVHLAPQYCDDSQQRNERQGLTPGGSAHHWRRRGEHPFTPSPSLLSPVSLPGSPPAGPAMPPPGPPSRGPPVVGCLLHACQLCRNSCRVPPESAVLQPNPQTVRIPLGPPKPKSGRGTG